MNVLKVGDIAPDFSCKNQYGELINLSDMKGKKIVVFFYPKANTPGCTAEACNLNDNYSRFKSDGLNAYQIQLQDFQLLILS